MRQIFIYFSLICLLFVSLLLVSCQPGKDISSSPTILPKTETSVAILPTQPPQVTKQIQSNFVFEIPVLTSWSTYDPRNNDLPSLFVEQNGYFAIDPNWQVESIEYVYKWWGLADPVFNYQSITMKEGEYFRDNEVQDYDLIVSFMNAMSNLRPSQFVLAGNGHTDDYPSWTLDITGVDGQHIMVFSTSTDNPGSGPWNIFDNGRLYVQYDGSLGEQVGKLFPTEYGSPSAAFFPGGMEPGSVVFATQGLPNQVLQGFVGLLPIADSFQYYADLDESSIKGYIQGRGSIGGFGTMVIGSITDIKAVSITNENESQDCFVSNMPSDDPVSAQWEFECFVELVNEGDIYHYPIFVEITTDDGRSYELSGELSGVWQNEGRVMVLPPPFEIQDAIAMNSSLEELLSDHVLVGAFYTGLIKPDKVSSRLAGELIFLGEAFVDGNLISYSVGIPFFLENGEFVNWDFDKKLLSNILSSVVQTPISRRILSEKPDAVLNLWYSEQLEIPEMPYLINANPISYQVEIVNCNNTSSNVLPNETEALIGFGFNSSWRMRQVDFVLLNNNPIVYEIDLFPYRDDRDGVLDLLLPTELITDERPQFGRIWMKNNSFFGKGAELTLWPPEGMAETDLDYYEQIRDSLPGQLDKDFESVSIWTINNLNFDVGEEGILSIIPCSID